ncbi:hypothetical protein C9J01_09985 [Photobacterium rosenbergii]|uniref:Protein BatD n=1 Tax=Photobacterium rosenbergii TaxID=294936 RepID=A0A2T3NF41_9GAMM|nr:BatD family protein [Photobacterium rosenbergii]PSW13179.1 hypothetical protein C9J01_09985 [Photobacterium rosenbergii]
MRTGLTSSLPVWLAVVISLLSFQSYAVTIDRLEKSNDVEIQAWLSDVNEQGDSREESEQSKTLPSFSVNEQIILYVEVATPRWFTGGTRIESVEIPNVIAKQRNQLATNYTERKGGQTWSRQRWEITLYPVKSGTFTVPSLAVNVQVSAPDGSNVSGNLYTQPMNFNVSLPSGLLSDDTPWFTATHVDVKQEWSQSSDELKVGDAITRKVTVNAQDSLSVLLPNLLKSDSSPYFQAYPQPHRLNDTQTRGDYQSSRMEETVYVIQQGGDFKLPEHQFQWWNAKTNKLETVTVEGKSFHARHTPASFVKANFHWLVSLLSTLVIVLIVLLGARRYFRTHPTPPWLLFWLEVRKGEWSKARAQLYRYLRVSTDHLEMGKADSDKAWLKTSLQVQTGAEKAYVFHKMWQMISGKKGARNGLRLPKALPKLDKGHKEG